MAPFEVKLSYNGKPWCTVPLEVGFNEIGDTDAIDWVEQREVSRVFESIGFPPLGRVPLMGLPYQVAQKLHAVTGGSDRVRDLIDLQLIAANAEIDFAATKRICARLFAYRKRQKWPPAIVKRDGWEELYSAQTGKLPALQRVEDAIAWTNELIASIESA